MSNTILLKCHNCDHEWNYGGRSLFYATCPKCRFKVKIRVEYPRARASKTEGEEVIE